ncbi:glycosyltransferase family 4 protein [Marinivivus vitaminiproducens]|uniref:glycosyltransferase family 4 protein n=1 Tax=Marinivivus vitaminiproducens TaxID=3035935 RepID=UPI0027A1E583|nr:glycosyltransferase family 4 protein [Geminicoccaceae bacterium SCSIO 64248]
MQAYFVGVVPPPVTGMTSVTKAVLERLETGLPIRRHAVSRPGWASNRVWSVYKHVALLRQCVSAALRMGRGDVVYCAMNADIGLYGDWAIASAARLRGARLIVHHHSFSYITDPDARVARFLRIAGPNVVHVMLCHGMRRRFSERYGPVQAIIVGNDAWTKAAIPVADTPRGTLRTVGFLSNITREKGIDTALACFRALSAAGRDLNFVIAGPAASAEIKRELDAFVAEDPGRRRLAGPVYGAAKTSFFEEIDALVFPTRYRVEADPLVVHESVSRGVPVLATPRGCLPERIGVAEHIGPDDPSFADWAAQKLAAWHTDPDAYRQASAEVLRHISDRDREAERECQAFLDLFRPDALGAERLPLAAPKSPG